MLEFEKLVLKNCVYFKDAELDLNSKQIYLVNGRNLKSRETNQSNGAGKSLLFSYIPNVLFGNHPMAIRANSKKDLFNAEAGKAKAQVNFKVDNNAYEVTQNGGSSVSYKIVKNGKHINVKTTASKSENLISDILPISQSEFYTLVYLNSLRPFTFQRGTFENRLSFFTEFFRLDYYDAMKEYFQDELKKVKRVEVEVSAYESQRLRFSEDIKELSGDDDYDLDELEEQKTELKNKRKKIQARISKLTKSKTYIELKAQLTKNIGKAERPSKQRIQQLRSLINELEEQLEIRSTVKSQTVKVKKYKAQLAEIKTELNTIYQDLFGKDFDEPFELDTSIETAYLKAKRENSDREDLVDELRDLKKRLKQATPTKKTYEALEAAISDGKQQIRTYNKIKEHLDDDTCPVCGSVVDLPTLKKKAIKAKDVIATCQKELSYLDITQEISQTQSKISELEEVDLTKLEKAFNDFKVKRDSYQKVQRLHSRLVSTQEQYNEERESLARNTKKVTDADTDKLDGYRDEVYNAKRLSSLYNQLDEVLKDAADADVDLTQDVSEVSSQIHKYEDQAINFESRIESISVKINKSNVQNEKRKMLTEKLHEVTERIEKLNSVIADKEILETLVKVYSSKGIKIQKINSICRLIEKNLNHFKSLLYGENFKFKIKITEKSFDVIVDRGDGVVSDVRLLSGSESRRFNLLLLISLLPLTPKSRRCNMVILDEMESNSDSSTIDMFCNRFVPELHKFIPNVIVVTPIDLKIPNAKRIFIVKDEKGSRLEHSKDIQG
jgi:DNA repair exonuclease SbcCD ATPase subunit